MNQIKRLNPFSSRCKSATVDSAPFEMEEPGSPSSHHCPDLTNADSVFIVDNNNTNPINLMSTTEKVIFPMQTSENLQNLTAVTGKRSLQQQQRIGRMGILKKFGSFGGVLANNSGADVGDHDKEASASSSGKHGTRLEYCQCFNMVLHWKILDFKLVWRTMNGWQSEMPGTRPTKRRATPACGSFIGSSPITLIWRKCSDWKLCLATRYICRPVW